MRTIPILRSFAAPRPVLARFLLLVFVGGLTAMPGVARAATRTLSREALVDKIRGGWAGQMIGVAYGAKSEFKSNGKINEAALPWVPGMLENCLHQDDLYVEMTFAAVMDKIGLDAKAQDYGRALRDSKYDLWHANAGARSALLRGIEAPWSGHPKYNFHADDIDFQIEADFIGLMAPGLPHTSNELCDRVGRVMNYGDGLYGGMFVCGMYSAAFFESNPRRIVEAGLACIPARSKYALLVRDLIDWSVKHPREWKQVWQLLEQKWDKDDVCPRGFQKPFNIDAKLNGAYIAMGLLFGGGDFGRTIEITTRCGQDSDCNPSSAAGVLGVMLGYRRIPAEFTADIPTLENRKFDFTEYSFNDIVKSTEARACRAIERAGGKITATQVFIPVQTPEAPALEQWSPGIPNRSIPVADPSWTFAGPWKEDKDVRSVEGVGGEATLAFDGVAVAILGRMHERGGRAAVYLDGVKQELLLDAYNAPRTHDVVLWQAYGLNPGAHTVRIVTSDQASELAKGKQVSLQEAVTYRAPTP